MYTFEEASKPGALRLTVAHRKSHGRNSLIVTKGCVLCSAITTIVDSFVPKSTTQCKYDRMSFKNGDMYLCFYGRLSAFPYFVFLADVQV
jgi:hypothetical protein